MSSKSPRDAFRNFLEKAEQDAWIASYRWVSADTYPHLKEKLGKIDVEVGSRSHKKGTDGLWWAVEVEAHEGTRVGVDLEIIMKRPILDRPDWITRRLNLGRPLPPAKILEEWSSREAGFKAFAPDNQKILMSHFRRSAPGTYNVFTPQGERSVQVRSLTLGQWVLSLAWRSLS